MQHVSARRINVSAAVTQLALFHLDLVTLKPQRRQTAALDLGLPAAAIHFVDLAPPLEQHGRAVWLVNQDGFVKLCASIVLEVMCLHIEHRLFPLRTSRFLNTAKLLTPVRTHKSLMTYPARLPVLRLLRACSNLVAHLQKQGS